uniref:Uncharacterized protein n=1 Tax=Caenorhabditis japonica TaxID=281687 RepID=A0A8R1IEJ6_CAEJA
MPVVGVEVVDEGEEEVDGVETGDKEVEEVVDVEGDVEEEECSLEVVILLGSGVLVESSEDVIKEEVGFFKFVIPTYII